MITKITVVLPNTLMFLNPKELGTPALDEATTQVRTIKHELAVIEEIIPLLLKPDANIEGVLLSTGYTPRINRYTKKKRSYWIPHLYVWEEDK